MRQTFIILITLGILGMMISCESSHTNENYFIISKDSTNMLFDCYRRNDTACLDTLKHFMHAPLPPPYLDWYSNIVIVFDSTDKVYLYQTQTFENNDTSVLFNKPIENTKYPSYIGLQPYHLIAFESNDFINFIKNNNEVFRLDTNNPYTRKRCFIYIVSNRDTIKNKAYYNLIDLITPKSLNGKGVRRVSYLVRLTTEEENNVIYYKRKKLLNLPYNIKWSENFINGNCRPFTKKYDSIEKHLVFIIKAYTTFDTRCTELPRIL